MGKGNFEIHFKKGVTTGKSKDKHVAVLKLGINKKTK